MPLFQTVHDLLEDAAILRSRRYGVVHMADGRLQEIVLRPWPKLISLPEVLMFGGSFHDRAEGDSCWLYYNQPWRHSNFLALKYVLSSREATFATFRGALIVLDEIARIKRIDAVVCEVTNPHF